MRAVVQARGLERCQLRDLVRRGQLSELIREWCQYSTNASGPGLCSWQEIRGCSLNWMCVYKCQVSSTKFSSRYPQTGRRPEFPGRLGVHTSPSLYSRPSKCLGINSNCHILHTNFRGSSPTAVETNLRSPQPAVPLCKHFLLWPWREHLCLGRGRSSGELSPLIHLRVLLGK